MDGATLIGVWVLYVAGQSSNWVTGSWILFDGEWMWKVKAVSGCGFKDAGLDGGLKRYLV